MNVRTSQCQVPHNYVRVWTGTSVKVIIKKEKVKGTSEQSPRHDTLSYLNLRDFR